MTPRGYIIAVDNGSQSTKVSIFDAEGRVHAHARVALRPYVSPEPGRWEHPQDDLWESVLAGLRLALARFSGDVADIRALGLCTIRFCRAVLRDDGTLAQPVMSWMDERLSRPYVQEREDARFVTTSTGYIAHRLTGEYADAAGNCQGIWPIDTATWDWDSDPGAYARTGMDRAMLFDLVQPGGVMGRITARAARETGLPIGLPVIASSNDKAVEALGAGLRDHSDMLLSLGTYVATMTPGGSSRADSSELWVNFGSQPGSYLFESHGVRRGMWTVSWFRELVSGGGVAVPETELDLQARDVPPGCGGLIASLDWLAPPDEPWRRGALVGFDGTQGRAHVYRAILEALAIQTEGHDARARESLGRGRRELIVAGGGSQSPVMREILAAVYRVPVRAPENPDAAGVGAAICAAVAVDLHPGWDEAVDAMARLGPVAEPDPRLVSDYDAVRERYARVIPRVQQIFAV